MSDRDAQFTGRFWTKLFKLLGSKLKFPSNMHLQKDCQIEHVNALLKEYFWQFVSANQKDWVNHLDIAQFSYNLQRSLSTQKSPFMIVTDRQPTTPQILVAVYVGNNPPVFYLTKE